LRTLTALLLAFALAGASHAGIPAGGMDLFADHWLTEADHRHHHGHGRPGYVGLFGDGPLRLTLYGLTIGNIDNNAASASTAAFIFATERNLVGPFFAGGSFGGGESDSLKWSHGEGHAGMLVSEQMAVRIGYNADTYDYLTNKTDDANVSRNLLRGVTLGADVFGSPAPNWFVQISGDVVPLTTELVDGTEDDTNGFTIRGSFLIGFSLWHNLDLSLVGVAVPRLGDSSSNAAHLGGGVSLTF
jgi:hypothetical protein